VRSASRSCQRSSPTRSRRQFPADRYRGSHRAPLNAWSRNNRPRCVLAIRLLHDSPRGLAGRQRNSRLERAHLNPTRDARLMLASCLGRDPIDWCSRQCVWRQRPDLPSQRCAAISWSVNGCFSRRGEAAAGVPRSPRPRAYGTGLARHRNAFRCQHLFPGRRLCRQLQHGCFLPFAQECQEQRLSVR